MKSSSLFIDFLRRLSITAFGSDWPLDEELRRLDERDRPRDHHVLPAFGMIHEVSKRGFLPMSEWERQSAIEQRNQDGFGPQGRSPFFLGNGGWGASDWGKMFGAVLRAGNKRTYSQQPSDAFNLYPSDLKGDCQDLAVFMALNCDPLKVSGLSTLKFKDAVEKMVQHQQGNRCAGKTTEMLLISTSWSTQDFQPWHGSFSDFKARGVTTRLALWTGNGWLETELG